MVQPLASAKSKWLAGIGPDTPVRHQTMLVELAGLAVVIAVFSWICFQDLWQPGLYGDEAWPAVSAAKFALGESVIDPGEHRQFAALDRTFPFMLNDYTGPVKAYILAAAFNLFGVSLPTLRITTSLLGLMGVVATYLMVRQWFCKVAAFGTASLLATDLAYALAVRNGWALLDVAVLARVAGLALLLSWARARQRWWLLFLGCGTLGLGLSHKFDFLSSLLAIGIAGTIFYLPNLRPRLRVREIVIALGGFLIGAWPILLYNLLTGGRTLSAGAAIADAQGRLPFPPRTVDQVLQLLAELPVTVVERALRVHALLDGTVVANWILAERVEQFSPLGASPLPLAWVISLVILTVVFASRHPREWLRPLAFFLAILATTLVLLAATPIATGPHHLMSAVYPVPHLLVGVALACLWGSPRRRPRWARYIVQGVTASAFAFLLLSNLLLAHAYQTRLAAKGGNWYWSESIYQLNDALHDEFAGFDISLLDWGFEQPLVILGRNQLKLSIPYWRVLAEEDPSPWLRSLIAEPGRLFVVRSERFGDRTVHQRFRKAYEGQTDIQMHERKFFQRDGEEAFSIVQFSPAGTLQ